MIAHMISEKESVLRSAFESHWRDLTQTAQRQGKTGGSGASGGAAGSSALPADLDHYLLEELIQMVAEQIEHPVESLRSQIQSHVADHDFVADNGDNVIEDHYQDWLERFVSALVDTLEQARRETGVGSESQVLTAPPQMFG